MFDEWIIWMNWEIDELMNVVEWIIWMNWEIDELMNVCWMKNFNDLGELMNVLWMDRMNWWIIE